MAYLRLVCNPDDDNAFVRIVNTPRREIGPSTLEKLSNYANQRNNSLFAASMELGLEQHLSARASERLRQFSDWVLSMQYRIEGGETATVVRQLINDIDYERWLMDNTPDEMQAQRKIDNVQELVGWITRLAKSDPEAKLDELVSKLALLDTLDREEEDEKGNRVHLMTLHAAKGLEFPHVFLVGMEEELLPHRSSIEEDNIEEERRLAYVGITRAKKTLTMTMAAQRQRYGEKMDCQPSRFIDELPQDDLHWSGDSSKVSAEQSRENGQATINSLKELLAGS
jgi:ATP-dependent DNA helicase Rep